MKLLNAIKQLFTPEPSIGYLTVIDTPRGISTKRVPQGFIAVIYKVLDEETYSYYPCAMVTGLFKISCKSRRLPEDFYSNYYFFDTNTQNIYRYEDGTFILTNLSFVEYIYVTERVDSYQIVNN